MAAGDGATAVAVPRAARGDGDGAAVLRAIIAVDSDGNRQALS
jgi:hypothetical protein